MSLTLEHIKKYAVRQKVLIILWFLILISYACYGVFLAGPQAANVNIQVTAPLVLQTFVFLQIILSLLLIPLIVHEDPAVGTTAFWLTRPLSRPRLLMINTVVILTLFAALPFIVEMIILAAHQLLQMHGASFLRDVLITKLSFVVGIYLLAALTRRFSHFALLTFITLISFIGAAALNIFLKKSTAILSGTLPSAMCLLIIGWGLLNIIHQYLGRQTKKTAFLTLGLGAALMVSIISYRTDADQSIRNAQGYFMEKTSRTYQTPVEEVIVSEGAYLLKEHTKQHVIRIPLRYDQMSPRQFSVLKNVTSARIQYPDETLNSLGLTIDPWISIENPNIQYPLQAALEDFVILNPFSEKKGVDEIYNEVFRTNDRDYQRLKNKQGTYTAQAVYDVYQYEVIHRVILKKGISSARADHIIIYDIIENPTGVTVMIGEEGANFLTHTIFDNMTGPYFKKTYILTNPEREEAYLLKMMPGELMDLSKVYPWPRLHWINRVKRLDFTYVTDEQGQLPRIDKEWLQQAQLIRLDAVRIKTVEADVKYEGFFLPEQKFKNK